MANKVNEKKGNTFVFLEILSREGGIQSYVRDIFQAYQDLTNSTNASDSVLDTDILLLRDGLECENPYQSNSINFYYLKTQPIWLGRFRLAGTLLWCLLTKQPQQVFCGHINLAPLVQILCVPLGIPYTIFTYGKEVWEPLPNKYQQALKKAASILTISRYSRDRCCENNHLDQEKFQLLPCMVDENIFIPQPKPKDLIERYNLEGSKVLMTVARLWSGDPYKGVDVTIRALPMILQIFPEVKYLVIGRGDDQPRLAKLAEDLGVEKQVIFAGFVPTEDLVRHYQVADAYVMPSQEGFGIVYLEAMACGIPVLSGDADGSADPLQDGKLGWRVPYRDPEAVANACIEMLKGEDWRCDGNWLREESVKVFGRVAFTERVKQLLGL
ncbi:MAG: glycosyltransferase family 4 protein [Okeania sp. SIO3H1]|uniref:glycosyltransferase family 4 protein n=1 Tax=Okeania sp. SIO1I7 TaxID=2607772 RepID=UPI0013CB718B|nr:glycosyltransferase family 4 protein [Okeania sp. SIO1I7]NEN92489.1 glycosyltransferase family 4 protein [Okeania sp. SIO3H1]NET25911.1 glycosyltransferase family 4 protein [Okeania sp. SIO1I7]